MTTAEALLEAWRASGGIEPAAWGEALWST
jgi:hypothetical protein